MVCNGYGQNNSSYLKDVYNISKWVTTVCTAIRTDAAGPLCQKNEETVFHLLGECSTLSVKCSSVLGSPYLSYETLGNMHWHVLLRLAKA